MKGCFVDYYLGSKTDPFRIQEKGTIYHSLRWWKIAKSLGYRPWLILCREEDQVIGSFSLFFKKGFLGSHLSGMPFGDFGEPLGLQETKRNSLLKADEIAKKHKVSLTFFSLEKMRYLPASWHQQKGFVFFTLGADDSYTTILKQRFHKKTRNMVRKAENQGVKVALANQGNLKRFYWLYLKTMRKLGNLPIPEKIFRLVWQLFPETRLFKAIYEKKIVGFLWVFLWKNTLWIWANATDEKFLHLGTNYSLYNEAIKLAIKTKEIRLINFGISKQDSSQSFFKSRWGAEEKIAYQISNSIQGVSKQSLTLIIRYLPLPIIKLMGELAYRYY